MGITKPIRLSTWTIIHKKNKHDVRVARDVVVAGNKEDVAAFANNFLYLGRVYTVLFGKKSFMKKRKDDQYKVVKIELDDKIIGYTNVSEKE